MNIDFTKREAFAVRWALEQLANDDTAKGQTAHDLTQALIKVTNATLAPDQEPDADMWRDMAREEWHTDGECEIDDNAIVSISESAGGEPRIAGAYVAAWVFVDAPEGYGDE